MARITLPPGPGVDPARFVRLVDALGSTRVVVLGDAVLDVYLYGTTHRISREAPVLIVREDGRETRLGGAANAAANAASLGATTRFVGLVGRDEAAHSLSVLFEARGIGTSGLVAHPSMQTVTKTRVLAGGAHTTKQQMLRIDREPEDAPDPAAQALLEDAALASLDHADALIVSDYGNGTLSPLYARIARAARALGLIVVVDSRQSLDLFHGATAVTPNAPEAAELLDRPVDQAATAISGAQALLERLGLEAVLLTRGREGMAIAERRGPCALLAAHGAIEAVDVTGAGDTVTAAFTLALAARASVLEGAVLANAAAALVVQRIGAATVTPGELLEALAAYRPEGLRLVAGATP